MLHRLLRRRGLRVARCAETDSARRSLPGQASRLLWADLQHVARVATRLKLRADGAAGRSVFVGRAVPARQHARPAATTLRHLAVGGVASAVHGVWRSPGALSTRCCGRECFGGADHFFAATRLAARVYMQWAFERFFTWPRCASPDKGPGCDTSGPAGALPTESISSLLAAHNVSMCKAGQGRAMVRSSNSSSNPFEHSANSGLLWLASPVHHKPPLPLRPLSHSRHDMRCPQRGKVCSHKDRSRRSGRIAHTALEIL